MVEKQDEITIQWHLGGISLTRGRGARFKHYYPSFQSSKVKDFMSALLRANAPLAERWLVVEKDLGNYIKGAAEREEFKELAYANLKPDLIVPSTLAFFDNDPERLFDPDYQILFEMFVLQPGQLQKALNLEGFADKIVNFIEKNVEKSRTDNQIQPIVFLARFSRYLYRIDNPRLKALQIPLLRDVLQIEGLDKNQKGVIYSGICANLSEKKRSR